MADEIRHFTDLDVWRLAHELFLAVASDARTFPPETAGRVVSEQLSRSLGSVCANIAEGFNRSRRRFVNSLDIALGEANEAENWLYKVRDADMMAGENVAQRLQTVVRIQKMLRSLKSKIAAAGDRAMEPEAGYALREDDG